MDDQLVRVGLKADHDSALLLLRLWRSAGAKWNYPYRQNHDPATYRGALKTI